MNKYLFILGLVGTALLSACSSDDLTTGFSPEEERALVFEASQDSDVPISLGVGMGRATTRTPIDTEDNLFETPEGKYFGVFCLATGKQEGAPSSISADIDWKTHALATWLNNVPARIVKRIDYNEVQFMTNLEGIPEQEQYYYPFGNWYHYNFYAYYPRITDAEAISVGSNSVIVNYEIDGRQDIIWGKTTDPENVYCAKYCREHPAETPQFEFEHKLAKLEVYVKGNSNFVVTSATISGVYTNLTLCVASNTSGENPTGNLTIKENTTPGELALSKVDTGVDVDPFNGGTTTIAVTAAEEKYIGYIMIPPTALLDESELYTINLKINEDLKHVDLKNSDESRMVFEEGKSYKITLNIN